MNDEHDNAQTDKEMLARYAGEGAGFGGQDITYETDAEELRTKTGRLYTKADLDQWSMDAPDLKPLVAERFEPTDDDYVNWREANDYLNEDPGHDE